MRSRLHVLLTGFPLAAAAIAWAPIASAQAVVADRFVVGSPSRVQASAVVDRLMHFDRDQDGRVTKAELAERMSGVVGRGDTNGDEALDADEIRAMVRSPHVEVAGDALFGSFQFGGGRYAFADEIGQTSTRQHIKDAIEDLRLPGDAQEEAIARAGAFVDTLEAKAAADLLNAVEPLLTPEQFARFTSAVAAHTERQRQVGNSGSHGNTTGALRAPALAHVQQFALAAPERQQALAAVVRYTARLKLGEEDHRALADGLEDLLDDEDRDNLRAALGRRPVVSAAATTASIPGAIVVPQSQLPAVRNLLLVR